jgi:hypothetical protein
MAGGSINIELGWPAKALSPNARVHYMEHARFKKAAHATAYWATRQVFRSTPPMGRASQARQDCRGSRMNAPWPNAFRVSVRPDALLASMDHDELRQVMRELGCRSQQSLATKIGVSRSAVYSWLYGRVGVPRHIAMLLRLLSAESA